MSSACNLTPGRRTVRIEELSEGNETTSRFTATHQRTETVSNRRLLPRPPAGTRDPSQRIENMLTRTLSLNATQQGQVHTILANAQVQSQAIHDQFGKPLAAHRLDRGD